jgi:hypothetical protein
MALMLSFAFFVACFTLKGGWGMDRAAVTAGIGLLAFISIRASLKSREWIRPFWTNRVAVDDAGVHLRIRDRGEMRLTWPEIQGITHQQSTETTGGYWPMPYQVDHYTLATAKGPFTFSSMDIPGAKRAAEEIGRGATASSR